MNDEGAETIRVLHVDDDPDVAELTAVYLRRKDDRFEIDTAATADGGLERLREGRYDCVVSDYDMPRVNGLEFLALVRDEYPDLPFILFTGKGSEEIASDAISAGVTDYLQKGSGADQYTVLANRITNVVSQYRAERAVEETQQRFRKLVKHSTDVISIVDANGRFRYLTPSAERVLGYEPEELEGEIGYEYIHSEDRQQAMEKFQVTIADPDAVPSIEFRFDHGDGSWRWLENRARNMLDDPVIEGFVVHTRDVTERKERERELERQNERLEEFARVVSHDLQNPLNVAKASLRLFDETGDEDHVDRADDALDRMGRIIDDLLTLAREGEDVTDHGRASLEEAATAAWRNVRTDGARLEVTARRTITADRERLQRLFENLFRNAIEHGSTNPRSGAREDAVEHGSTSTHSRPCEDAVDQSSTNHGAQIREDAVEPEDADITVRVGEHEQGFYVEDDGAGIPEECRQEVFEVGHTTSDEGTGFGLSIVRKIADAHSWEVRVTEGEAGGARFEILGPEP